MRKSIDFTKKELEKITQYQKDHELKNFTKTIKHLIEEKLPEDEKNEDDLLVLIGNAIVDINEKVDKLVMHTAPKSAGSVRPGRS